MENQMIRLIEAKMNEKRSGYRKKGHIHIYKHKFTANDALSC